jgi:hypothetical protein
MSYAEISILAGGNLAILVAYLAITNVLVNIRIAHYLILLIMTVIVVASLKLQLDVASGSEIVTAGRGLAMVAITLEFAAAALIIGRSVVVALKGFVRSEPRSQADFRKTN